MSGFECIGVILGVWPLVVNGLQLYKQAKNGPDWELLFDEFRTEEIIYVECIRHLLASDTSEADLLQLSTRDKPNQALWRDPALHNSLRNRLGHDKSPMVLKTFQEMDMLLTTLNQKLKSQEAAIERSASRFHKTIHNVKTIIPQATVRDSLRKLRDLNGRLQRLLTNSASSGYPAQGRTPKTSTGLPPDVLRRISAQANELHDAINEGYSCKCRDGHEANLGLHSPEDLNLIQPFEIVFPVDEDTAKQIIQPDQASPTTSSMASYESDTKSIFTQRRWSHRGSVETMASTLASPMSSPPFRGRSISLSKSSGLEHGGLIDDLCNFIRKLGEQNPIPAPASCLGVLGVKEKKYTVQVTSLDGYTSEPPSLVSLDDYLSPLHKAEITRKKRMDLALSLSLAILQFYKTPWIDMWWTWKDFCILRGDKSQIFVTKRFYSSHTRVSLKAQAHPLSTSAFWECFGEPVLTRLGFALVELALGQRLSELRDKQEDSGSGDEDMLDLVTAKHLVGEGRVLDEAGQCYHDAVQACLTHQVIMDNGVRGLNSKHVNFELDVERFVVAPIRDSFQASWRLIPKLEM